VCNGIIGYHSVLHKPKEKRISRGNIGSAGGFLGSIASSCRLLYPRPLQNTIGFRGSLKKMAFFNIFLSSSSPINSFLWKVQSLHVGVVVSEPSGARFGAIILFFVTR
jgi:hypothetical protein